MGSIELALVVLEAFGGREGAAFCLKRLILRPCDRGRGFGCHGFSANLENFQQCLDVWASNRNLN